MPWLVAAHMAVEATRGRQRVAVMGLRVEHWISLVLARLMAEPSARDQLAELIGIYWLDIRIF